MGKLNANGKVPAVWEAAEEILARPPAFPEPADLDLVEWLRRVPAYLEEIETLVEPLVLLRPGTSVDGDDRRLVDALVARLPALRRQYEAVTRIADQRDLFAETFDPTREPVRHWQRAHALRMWRDADEQLARPHLAPYQEDYEAAINRLLASLQPLTTMDELVGLYFSDAYKTPLAEACTNVSEETLLLPVLVLDAACWRRARQLVATLPDEPEDEQS